MTRLGPERLEQALRHDHDARVCEHPQRGRMVHAPCDRGGCPGGPDGGQQEEQVLSVPAGEAPEARG